MFIACGHLWKKDVVRSVGGLLLSVISMIIQDMVQYAKNATIIFLNKTFNQHIYDFFEIKTYNKAYNF